MRVYSARISFARECVVAFAETSSSAIVISLMNTDSGNVPAADCPADRSLEDDQLPRPVVEVFLDEAGYTGPDLINRDQPAFVLASTILDADRCRALLDTHFGSDRD
jgi:hypothetical protein